MELKDLIDKPASECTDEELEKQAHLLSKLKIVAKRTSSTKKPKIVSNAERQLNDLVKGLSKEQLAKLLAKMKEDK